MKIVTLGEIMLRLSPPNALRLVQSEGFDACYGGSEANVAVALANYGHESVYVTKVPAHEIGQAAVNALRRYGVNTAHILRGGTRLGVYYYESGTSLRPGKVIYDRAGSAMATAKADEFDPGVILDGADWFHWSGITPALSADAAELIRLACIEAGKRGIPVSCDVNFRTKLWSTEQATKIMKPLMSYVDVFFGNAVDAHLCLGYPPVAERYDKEIIKNMTEEFGFQVVAFTRRDTVSATRNGLSGVLFDGENFCESSYYDIDLITERVGTGDAFAAGVLHGLVSGWDKQRALEFGVAAGALKHTVRGDFGCSTEAEVLALAEGAAKTVQR